MSDYTFSLTNLIQSQIEHAKTEILHYQNMMELFPENTEYKALLERNKDRLSRLEKDLANAASQD